MSNYLSVAVVTAALQQIIQEVVEEAVPGATVRVGPPRAPGVAAGPEVNLYLYMLSPNASLRNQSMPTRSASGVLLSQPDVAVDLHYIIAFYGEGDLASERMMGKVAARFNAYPILTPDLLRAVIRNDGSFGYLSTATLPDDPTMVRLNPYFSTLEELSKLWTVFFQMAHRISLQYIAGPVRIDSDLHTLPIPAPASVRSATSFQGTSGANESTTFQPPSQNKGEDAG